MTSQSLHYTPADRDKRASIFGVDRIIHIVFVGMILGVFSTMILAIIFYLNPTDIETLLLSMDTKIVYIIALIGSIVLFYGFIPLFAWVEYLLGGSISKHLHGCKLINKDGTKPIYKQVLIRKLKSNIPLYHLVCLVHFTDFMEDSYWHDGDTRVILKKNNLQPLKPPI
jgi:uncharacterized RDD family membrane protein YckC